MIKRPKNDTAAGPEAEAMRLIADVESRLGGLRDLHERQRRSEQELAEKERRIAQTDEEVKRLQAAIEEKESELQRERDEISQREQQVAAQIEAMSQREQASAEREAALESRTRELEERLNDLNQRESGAGAAIEGVQQREEQLAGREQQLTVREEAIEQRERELEERLASLQRAVSEREQQLEAWAGEQEQKFKEREQELKERFAGAERELAERAQSAERSPATEQASAEISRLTERLAEAEQLAAQRGEEVMRHQNAALELSAQVDQLKAGAANASLSGGSDEHVAQLRDELERVQSKLIETSNELEALRTAGSVPGDAGQDELMAELEDARMQAAEVTSLREQLDELRQQASLMRSDYEQKLAQARSGGGGATGSSPASSDVSPLGDRHLETRRRRLHSVRKVIKGREQKISRAVEVLRERQKECEAVLANKSLLEKQLKEVEKKRAKVQSAAARTKAGAFMLYVSISAGIMAVLSWAIAGHVAPGTYVATATLAAQNLDREPEPYELEEWQESHEALLTDKQFITMAAERMSRRGLTSLGKPTLLQDRIESDLTHRSARHGELTVEYRGQGRSRTELELNTYITALRSYADANKAQRRDGASTIIVSEAAASDAPLADQRPMYAGGIFGGSMLLVCGLGGLVWRRLASDKEKFEAEALATEMSADTEWVEPELSASAPRR